MNSQTASGLEKWSKIGVYASVLSGPLFIAAIALTPTYKMDYSKDGGFTAVAMIGMWVILAIVVLLEYRKAKHAKLSEGTIAASRRLIIVLSAIIVSFFTGIFGIYYVW